jgi:uncharacterized membrane protein
MNQRLRALGLVAIMLGISVGVAVVLKLAFTYITPEAAPFVVTAIGISFCAYVLYSIALAKIEFDDKLKSMVDKK